jgi:hypothetical protein
MFETRDRRIKIRIEYTGLIIYYYVIEKLKELTATTYNRIVRHCWNRRKGALIQ